MRVPRRILLTVAVVCGFGFALVSGRIAVAQEVRCDDVIDNLSLATSRDYCGMIGDNWACYGYVEAAAFPDTVVFSDPGHQVELLEVHRVNTVGPYGTVLMRLRTEHPDPVELALFGQANLAPTSKISITTASPATAGAFILRADDDDRTLCERTLSGLVVQTESGRTGRVQVNGVDILLRSAAYITMLEYDEEDLDLALVDEVNEMTIYSLQTGEWGIFASSGPAREPRPLIEAEANNYHPSWSPDGNRIAFQSNRDGNNEIYVMDMTTQQVQRLTNHPAYDIHPAWSPEGDQIAFDSNRNDNLHIFVMDVDGQNVRQLTDHPAQDRWPDWSHDSQRIAFYSDLSGNRDIYVMDADGANIEQLTTDPADDRYPAWSNDDLRIAFASDRDGDWEIYVMDADGANVEQLTFNDDAIDWGPIWLPNGRISFSSVRLDDPANNEIYIMDDNGANLERITTNRWHDELPLWRPLSDAQLDLMLVANLTGTVEVTIPGEESVVLREDEEVRILIRNSVPLTISLAQPSVYATSPVANWLAEDPQGLPGLVEPTCGGTIAYGDTVAGEVTEFGEECVYGFPAVRGDVVTVVMAPQETESGDSEFSTALVPYLDLRDDTPRVIDSSAGLDESGAAVIQEFPIEQSGAYRIVAHADAHASRGPFTLNLEQVRPTCRVVTSALNLRNGPGTEYAPPIGVLSQGDMMEPLGRYGGWIQVRVDRPGALGWVSTGDQYIACNIDLGSLPLVTPPPPPTPTPTPITPTPTPVTPTPTPVTPTPTPTPSIVLPSDAQIEEGYCVLLAWDIQFVREVYFNRQGVAGIASKLVCPSSTTTYEWLILLPDGSQRIDTRTVTVIPRYVDEDGPVFGSLSSNPSFNGGPICFSELVIRIAITDPSGVERAELWVLNIPKGGFGGMGQIPLSPDGNVYSATIRDIVEGSLRFGITAWDELGNSSFYPKVEVTVDCPPIVE